MSEHIATAVLSSKGQIVIPAELRRAAKLSAGDRVEVTYSEATGEMRLRKGETIDEMAERFTSYIKPGTPPLKNASEFYRARNPRR